MLLAGALVSCGGGGGDEGGGGDATPPTVSITAPAFGTIVSGNISVTVAATDNVGIAGVQLQLNGTNVGIEDSTEPYSANWDTRTVGNGFHTFTAVARDAAGNRTTSAAVRVTVSNPVQPPLEGRVEETDASVSYSPGWTQVTPFFFGWSGGTAVQSMVPGATATFTFSGTSVTWIGNRNGSSGIALVKVDGVLVAETDLFARPEEIHTPVITVNGLSAARHTLTIEVTGRKHPESIGTTVVVDGYDVPARVVSHLQETDPDVVFGAGWVQADPDIAWSGGGVATVPDPPVGGARVSATPDATVTLAFRGTAISWSGYRGPNSGIAKVYVDDVLENEIDTYSLTNKIQDIIFTKTGLADAPHTLTIEATGRKNDFSTDAQIVVDAFDVTTPGRRYQEEDPAVAYEGNWIFRNLNRTWSEGTISEASTPGAAVTFTFTGTSVSWIGCRKLSTGDADIYLDGNLVKHVSTWLEAAPPNTLAVGTEAYQTTIFRMDDLPKGPHTLRIEVTSTNESYTVIDAFDVRP